MESDCRITMSCLRPRILALQLLFWGLISLRVFGAALLSVERTPVTHAVTAPCWQVEDKSAPLLLQKTVTACDPTGYVERINCAQSHKDEYKSCRSTLLEESLFWKFEGSMVGLTVVFALIVVARQRSLDRLASEKSAGRSSLSRTRDGDGGETARHSQTHEK
ncbi:hypothetical protein AAFF_G00250630 [Aldrovandia affinis]|uniref:Uncharacterized protein n=1 Tax=Aldrovandia affinis TaxID=143900 RepID=A0AAD7RD00_9TELE|nr:hypothetical protein AAFF_G00250630 [Aldrovandia affinis]